VTRGRATPPQWAGLKFFNVYGPNETHKGFMQSLVSKIFPTVKAGETVTLFKSHDPIYPDGGQQRDFIYIKDCVAVVSWLLRHPETSGLFNVGTGTARSFLDLVRAVCAVIGCLPNIRFIDTPEELRAQYQYFTRADVTKLRGAGFDASFYSLEDGVRDYLEQSS
jgi:ADP-L-glycero-D-manno-heptose 6-epimerase